MSDWITHDGKGCPVNENDLVVVVDADGNYFAEPAGFLYSMWEWAKPAAGCDIIAYQVVKPYKGDNG